MEGIFDTEEETEEDDCYNLNFIIENPIQNAVLFTAMRVVRFICTVLFEIVALSSSIVVGVFGFFTACWAGAFVIMVVGNIVAIAVGFTTDFTSLYAKEFTTGVAFASPLVTFLMKSPYLVSVPAFIIMIVSWGQALSFGIPYRWKNLPPGTCTAKCYHCHEEIVDEIRCGKCKKFLTSGLAMKAIWSVNVLLTTVWAIHDLSMACIGFSRGN